MRLFRRFASLRITVKFSLAVGLLLVILLLETVIGYGSLTVVLESNKAILTNTEMQRLALGMSRNWETVKRLRHSFFSQSTLIGVDQSYDIYALSAGGKITEVIRDGATLMRLATSPEASSDLVAREPDLKFYLATVSQYATTFEDATELEFQLLLEDGLRTQLEYKANDLFVILQAANQPADMLAAYYEMRFYEKGILASLQNISKAVAFTAISRLHRAIDSSSLPREERELALSYLNDYETKFGEINLTAAQVQEKRDRLDALDESIEPVLIELMVAVDREVGLARLHIERTRQVALRVLVGSTLFGLLSAGIIAVLLHYSVTRKIINLTRVTNQFHAGNLEARAQLDSADELGELSSTFNEMAESVQRLNAELREQAIRDALTGLFNRRYLDETLPRELARASRDGVPISMVMIDLDHLKEINDTYGHPIGDRILMELGHLLKSESRVSDVACRYGGDEFIILMLNARLAEGMKRAEAWRQIFCEILVSYQDVVVQSTISMGVVEWSRGETSVDLIARVDAALYRAKNAGRNRVATQKAFEMIKFDL
jgi:diguanylate cyclase (GGDEF)-like protein